MKKLLLVLIAMPVVAFAAPAYVESRTAEPAQQQNEKANLLSVIEQVNLLQGEIQELRGLIEQQQHQIDTLKQNPQAQTPGVQLSQASPGGAEQSATLAKAQDGELYDLAYQDLQNRHYSEAIERFKSLVQNYPDSKYAVNARYWMGEIYLLQAKNAEAKEAFSKIVQEHPNHPKAADAMLKLGYIAYNSANQSESIQVFNEVKRRFPGSASARLAQTRLDAMKNRG